MPPLRLLPLLFATACTDPLAGNWQSHGPDLVGDFEIFLDEDLVGHVDLARRSAAGTLVRVEQEVSGALIDRNNGIWFYEIPLVQEADLECELDRFTDELTCEWDKQELEFEPYEEDDSNCDGISSLGEPRKADCSACIASVCALDKFCCSKAWDVACREQALNNCGGGN